VGVTSVVFYFQVHQPYRLRRYSYFDIGSSTEYFDEGLNRLVLERVAERCYLPMNALLREAIERSDGRFRCAFSISGPALRQFEEWAPEVVESFRALLATGAVEMLAETSQHSLAALADPTEFALQVETHVADLGRVFDVRPTTFRNTELIVDESIARQVEQLGFDTLLGEGADQLLGWRTPHVPYRPRGCGRLALLLRAYSYSDDIAFRFSNREWEGYPLLADTFADWLDEVPREAPFIGLFMDYETFGEHQWKETGILEFMRALPERVLAKEHLDFATPAEIARRSAPAEELAYPRPISWADAERDLSAWLGNHMQRAAHEALYALAADARAAAAAGAPELYDAWRKLSTSDHTYYMSTKFAAASDGDVHEYFSPYDTPHDAFITYMNVVEDLSSRIARRAGTSAARRRVPSE
jgi:alpha-amylase